MTRREAQRSGKLYIIIDFFRHRKPYSSPSRRPTVSCLQLLDQAGLLGATLLRNISKYLPVEKLNIPEAVHLQIYWSSIKETFETASTYCIKNIGYGLLCAHAVCCCRKFQHFMVTWSLHFRGIRIHISWKLRQPSSSKQWWQPLSIHRITIRKRTFHKSLPWKKYTCI